MTTKIALPPYTVPALDIDAEMATKYGRTLGPRQRLERRIVAALGAYLGAAGFVPALVDYGDDRVETPTIKDAMELIFNLDDAWLYFKEPSGRLHGVYLVLGNSGDDVISDYTCGVGELDFQRRMDAFTGEGIDAIVAAL